jgi:hypothetical protein
MAQLKIQSGFEEKKSATKNAIKITVQKFVKIRQIFSS